MKKILFFNKKDGNEVARIDDDGKFYVGGNEGVIISQGAIQIKNGGTQSYIDFVKVVMLITQDFKALLIVLFLVMLP